MKFKRYLTESSDVIRKKYDSFKSDLKRITKIYKDSLEGDDMRTVMTKMVEASKLINVFSRNFEDWVYKNLLPEDPKSFENVRKAAWTAIIDLNRAASYVSEYHYELQVDILSVKKSRDAMNKNLSRYQRSFREAFKAIDDYLNTNSVVYTPDEHLNIEGVNVVVKPVGREKYKKERIDQFISVGIRDAIRKIKRAKFGKALDGLSFIVQYVDSNLIAGTYDYNADEMEIYGIGNENTIIHEVGHRFWYKYVPSNAKEEWEKFFNSNNAPIEQDDIQEFYEKFLRGRVSIRLETNDVAFGTEKEIKSKTKDPIKLEKFLYLLKHNPAYTDDPEKMLDHHMKLNINDIVPVKARVTSYGTTNPREAFAETFMEYVSKGPGALAELTLELFKRVCRASNVILNEEEYKDILESTLLDQ